jgi:hypothetical protein
MRRFLANVNPLVRGLAVVALIALVVIVLNLGNTVASLFLIARIAFPLAIAFFLFMLWRERRGEIALWSTRQQFAFYGGVLTVVAAFVALVVAGFAGWSVTGLAALALVLTVLLCVYAVYRVWRETHTYGG